MSLPKFNDLKGREYYIHLDFATLRTIRAIGVDFGNTAELGRVWAEVLMDDLKALEAIWIAVAGTRRGEQCGGVKTEAGMVTHDEWLQAMDGGTLEAAREALRQAVVNFTPPAKRAMATAATEGVMKQYRQLCSEATAQITTLVDEAVSHAKQHGLLPPELPASSGTLATSGR